MKRVGIVSVWPLSQTSFAGTEKFVGLLAVSLDKLGYKITCVSPANENFYKNFPHENLDIKAGVIDENYLKNLMGTVGVKAVVTMFSNALGNLITRNKYDYLILNSPMFCLLRSIIPSILVLHDSPEEMENYFGKSNKNQLLTILKTSGAFKIVTPSKYYQKIYPKMLGREIMQIPHALSASLFNKGNRRHKNKQLAILVPSRLEPKQKGQDLAIQAVAIVRKQLNKKILLKLSGLDSTYESNKTLLTRMADKAKVLIEIKNYSNISQEIINADVILLPSRYESFGYAAMESLALGKTVVLSDIPTYKEIGRSVSNAHFFKSGDVRDLQRILLQAINSPQVFPSKTWYKRFNPKDWARRYAALLESIF